MPINSRVSLTLSQIATATSGSSVDEDLLRAAECQLFDCLETVARAEADLCRYRVTVFPGSTGGETRVAEEALVQCEPAIRRLRAELAEFKAARHSYDLASLPCLAAVYGARAGRLSRQVRLTGEYFALCQRPLKMVRHPLCRG